MIETRSRGGHGTKYTHILHTGTVMLHTNTLSFGFQETPVADRKEKEEDTEQKVCLATSNIYSGAAVLSKHYASELRRN